MRLCSLLAVFLLAVAVSPARCGGPITGRFLVVGETPQPARLDPGRDACCREAGPIDESLLVGPEGGLANLVVWVVSEVGTPPRAAGAEPLVLTNAGCAFQPRVVLARVGQTLTLANDDPTTHNVNATFRRNASFNVVLEPNGRRDFLLDKVEPKPGPVACNIHPFMRSWVLVRDDPYFAVTTADGRFAISEGLPAGRIRLQMWHEGRYLAGVSTVHGETDRRGRLEIDPVEGPQDLGVIRLPVERFLPTE
ncbi:MAG: hypothetical protein AAFV43_06005 [Planctomycetota bacterium]